jgi:RES domain-containing protein
MRAFRIADRRFPLFDGTGARLAGGRWNSPGRSLIYAAETYAGALLEVLVHANLGRLPRTQAWIEITIPDEVAAETVTAETVPCWDSNDLSAARAFGDSWLEERRSAVLLVPSLVTRGRERNVLINPEHRQFSAIQATKPRDVAWDERLFPRRTR